MINNLAEERQADRVMWMSQLQILHANMCQIANQAIHMLIPNNNVIGPPPGNAMLSGTQGLSTNCGMNTWLELEAKNQLISLQEKKEGLINTSIIRWYGITLHC